MLIIKRLSIILILLFCAMIASAQIQRNILGCNLGTSTKSAVANTLKQKGIRYENLSATQIGAYNVTFGGIDWKYVIFNFFNNKLFQVDFGCTSLESSSEHLNVSYNRVLGVLKKKYQKYYSPRYSTLTNTSFDDNTTGVDLNFETKSDGITILSLDYKYYPLFDKYTESQEAEF